MKKKKYTKKKIYIYIYIYIYCGHKGSRKPPISSTYDFLFFRGILVHIFNKKIFYNKNYLKFIFWQILKTRKPLNWSDRIVSEKKKKFGVVKGTVIHCKPYNSDFFFRFLNIYVMFGNYMLRWILWYPRFQN